MARLIFLWCLLTTLVFPFGLDTKIVHQETNKYRVTGRIPKFVNKDNNPKELSDALKRANKEIEVNFTEIKREVISSAVQFGEDFPNSNLLPFTLDSTYVFTSNSKLPVSSFLIETIYYTGGAHPVKIYKGYNLDKYTYYTLDSFFRSPEKAREYIVENIQQKIKENLKNSQLGLEDKIYFDNARADLNDSTFYFRDNKFVILFQSYAIAPYASGNPEFTFTFGELKEFLHNKWTGI